MARSSIRSRSSNGLLDSWDLFAVTGFDDPEDVAYDAATRTIWGAFDSDARVGRLTLPEPASAGLAATAVACLGALAAARRA